MRTRGGGRPSSAGGGEKAAAAPERKSSAPELEAPARTKVAQLAAALDSRAAPAPPPEVKSRRGPPSLQNAFGQWASWDSGELPLELPRGGAGQPNPVALFETFRTAEDLPTSLAAFGRLFRRAVLAPNAARSGDAASSTCPPPWAPQGQPWRYPYEAIRVLLGGHWKAKHLWGKLDARCARPEYMSAPCANGHFKGRRAVIVGAGPSGLRAAIELRLLGAQVTVLERRNSFTRLNRLHLWHWCGEELKALGARCLEPPPLDFGADPDLLHIGIAELQALLLKTSLLLGVQVLLGASYCGAEWMEHDSTEGWVVRVRHATSGDDPSGPTEVDGILGNVAVVVGAGGLSCGVGKAVGLDTMEVGSLRSEEAIGLVCNFQCTPSDRSLRSFALARQFYDKLFQKLQSEVGAELENIVYTKSKSSHYFVMTPTRRCLAECGVLIDPSARPALVPSNLDREALDTLVRKIVAFHFKEGENTLPEVAAKDGCEPRYADGGPQLFDFSKMKRVAEGLTFLPPPGKPDAEGDAQHLMVALAGDALVEPFWPEGLGVVRGFFGALDAAWAASRWAVGAPREAVCAEFAATYGQLKSLAAQSRCRILRDDEGSYGVAPSTRYRVISPVDP